MATRGSLPTLVGLLCLVMAGPAAGGNLVMNAGFETDTFQDWSLSGNTSYTLVSAMMTSTKGGGLYAPQEGHYYALLGPVGSLGSLTQTIATTPGQEYTFRWWMASDGDYANEFRASWNGASVFDEKDISRQGFQEYSSTVQATGTSSTIAFAFRDDPGYLALDDISVTAVSSAQAVPEPSTLVLAGLGAIAIAAASMGKRRRTSSIRSLPAPTVTEGLNPLTRGSLRRGRARGA